MCTLNIINYQERGILLRDLLSFYKQDKQPAGFTAFRPVALSVGAHKAFHHTEVLFLLVTQFIMVLRRAQRIDLHRLYDIRMLRRNPPEHFSGNRLNRKSSQNHPTE